MIATLATFSTIEIVLSPTNYCWLILSVFSEKAEPATNINPTPAIIQVKTIIINRIISLKSNRHLP